VAVETKQDHIVTTVSFEFIREVHPVDRRDYVKASVVSVKTAGDTDVEAIHFVEIVRLALNLELLIFFFEDECRSMGL